jgi:hypothetical protein
MMTATEFKGTLVMPNVNIAPDDTIATVLETLTNKEEYVRTVLANMAECRRQFGSCGRVYIGVTGGDKAPHHKITYINDRGNWQTFGAFNGKKPFKDVVIHDNSWSTAHMSIEDVQAVLGELRGFKAAGKGLAHKH